MIRILFLAANPDNAETLLAGDELRQIEAALKHTRFQVIAKPAAHLGDLRSLLHEYKPQIVHFSGHGSRYGELLFVDEQGQSQPAPAQALTNLFKLFNQQVRCVILNACYSADQAAAIGAEIDCVLGFEGAILDSAARTFAATFYSALAAGDTLAVAKDHGLNEIELRLPNALQPCHVSGRRDAAAIRPLDWDDEAPLATRKIFGLYPFNEHFFGREDELVELHNLLQAQTPVSICPVITGMGGLGKTQLAAHYARAHVDAYPDGIFWITAANLNEIRPQLADFCVALGLPVADPQRSGDLTEQKISAFKHYLDHHPHALLIFDNVEEPDRLRTRQIGVQITALTLGGKVIITTRRRKLPSDRFTELALQKLSPAPARQILATARAELASDPDLNRLCEQFGYLPLMLNLAAAALKKRGGAIAGYLQRLHTLGAEKLHSEVAKVSLDDYHHSLSAVLHEQWAMLHDENARLLLRVAGQLPEATVIPTARLGLLAGLVNVDEWERPLSDALEELEAASLIERVDKGTGWLHPLVRKFVGTLTPPHELAAFCIVCAQRMADAYALEKESGLRRLGQEYADRGIAAILLDLITVLGLLRPADSIDMPLATHQSQLTTNLQAILQLMRLEANHLQGPPTSWKAQRLWQQLLPRVGNESHTDLTDHLSSLLCQTFYWLPRWGHQRQSSAMEQMFTGHMGAVWSVAGLDSNRIVSASADGTLKVWNLQTSELDWTFTGHTSSVFGIAVLNHDKETDPSIVSASADGTLKVWNLQTGELQQTFTAHKGSIYSIALVDSAKKTDQRLISASDDGTLKVWNLQTGQVEQTLDNYKGQDCIGVVDSKYIIAASADGSLKIWNIYTGQIEQRTLTYNKSMIHAVAVVDGNIVSALDDGTLKVWNLQTGQLQKTLTGHEEAVWSVAVLDTEHIVSASADRTIKVWNLQTGQVEQTLSGHESSVLSVTVLNAQRILSASEDGMLKIWNLQTYQPERTQTSHESFVNSVAMLDGKRIVSASNDSTLRIWNLQDGQLQQTLTGHKNIIRSVALIDSQYIVSASDDSTIMVWSLNSGQPKQIACKSPVLSVKVLDSGIVAGHLISASADGVLTIWDMQTGELKQTLTGHTNSVFDLVVLHSDTETSQRVVSASADHTLKVWNLHTTSQPETTLIGHKGFIRSITVLNLAKERTQRIVSASADRTIKVWDLLTGECKQTLIGHEGTVWSVVGLDTVKRIEQCIVSASADRTLKVWNLQTEQIIASIEFDSAMTSVTVAQQGDRILVVAGDAAGALYCLELVEPQ